MLGLGIMLHFKEDTMKELEVLRKSLKATKEFRSYASSIDIPEWDEQIQALSYAISLIEQVEKVEAVLPKDLPRKLHEWYLEATSKIHKINYNPHAHKPFEELNEEQQFIDKYIANACLHQVKLNLAKAGLVRKPTVEEVLQIIYKVFPPYEVVSGLGKTNTERDAIAFQDKIKKEQCAQAIVDRMEEGE